MLGLATAEQRPNLHFSFTDTATGIAYQPPAHTGWRYSKERINRMLNDRSILFPKTPEGRPREKKFKKDLQNPFTTFPTIIDDVHTSHGTEEVLHLFGFKAFEFPKPVTLLRRFIEQTSSANDIIMDLFAGSCSTAHAVMAQNHQDGGQRRYICVQIPERTKAESEAARRGYTTISRLGLDRIKRTVTTLSSPEGTLLSNEVDPANLAVRVFRLAESRFRSWRGLKTKDAETYVDQLTTFTDTLEPGWEAEEVVWEVALREGYPLTSQIEKRDVRQQTIYRITDSEREQRFHVCLDSTLDMRAVRALDLTRTDLFVCRDAALDDTLTANLALQCRLKVL